MTNEALALLLDEEVRDPLETSLVARLLTPEEIDQVAGGPDHYQAPYSHHSQTGTGTYWQLPYSNYRQTTSVAEEDTPVIT